MRSELGARTGLVEGRSVIFEQSPMPVATGATKHENALLDVTPYPSAPPMRDSARSLKTGLEVRWGFLGPTGPASESRMPRPHRGVTPHESEQRTVIPSRARDLGREGMAPPQIPHPPSAGPE